MNFRGFRRSAVAAALLGLILPRASVAAQSCPATITSCGCTIDAPGRYTVGALLIGSAGADCIAITSHHVALDLQGNPIAGPGAPDDVSSSGIHAKLSAHHVTIRGSGAAISGFGFGLEIEASHVTAKNFTTTDDDLDGVVLDGAHYGHIADFRTGNNADLGVVLEGGSQNNVEGVEANNNGHDGILFSSSVFCIASPFPNSCACVLVRDGYENALARVEANNNGHDGIAVTGASRNRIANFTADSNGSDGVSASQVFCPPSCICTPRSRPARHNSIENGEASSNGTYGIGMDQGSRRTRVTGNTTSANGTEDLFDFNPDCDHDRWKDNTFATSNRGCIH